MPGQVSHGEISIPVLDELASQPVQHRGNYSPEVDAALWKYAPSIATSALTWRKLTEELNREYGLEKSHTAYRSRWARLRDGT